MIGAIMAPTDRRRSGNRRTGALLILMAVLFFLGIVIKTWLFGR